MRVEGTFFFFLNTKKAFSKRGVTCAKKGGNVRIKKIEPYSPKGFSGQNSLIYLIYLKGTRCHPLKVWHLLKCGHKVPREL